MIRKYKYIPVIIILLCLIPRAYTNIAFYNLFNEDAEQVQESRSEIPFSEEDLKALLDSSIKYNNQEYEKAFHFANELLRSQELSNFPELKIRAYQRMGWLHLNAVKYDSANYYFKHAVAISEFQNDRMLYLRSLRGLARSYVELGQITTATHVLNEIISERTQINDSLFLSTVLSDLSNRYKDLANYDKALAYALEALALRQEMGVENRISSTYITVANIYRHIGDFENAKIFADKAYELLIKNKAPLDRIYNQYGLISLDQGDYAIAFEYSRKAYDLKSSQGDIAGMGKEMNNMSNSLRLMGKYEEALGYLFSSLRLKRESKDIRYYAPAFITIGKTYLDLGNFSLAERYLDSAMYYSELLDLNDRKFSVYDAYVRLYDSTGNTKQALRYYRLYAALKDSIYEFNTRNKIAEYTALYDIEQHKNENELLKRDNEIKSLTIIKQNNQRLVYFLIIGLGFLIILFIYFRFNQKKKANKSLKKSNAIITKQKDELKEVNATKDKFFSIIAHDLKSPFNSILGFTEILDESYDDYTDEERKKMIATLTKTSKNSFLLLQNLLTWARSQKGGIEISKEKIQLKGLVDVSILSYLGSASLKEIEINSEIDDNISVFVDTETMRTVIGNIVNNSIKYSNKGGEINIKSEMIEKDVLLSISDNGIGMSEKTLSKLFRIEESFSIPGTADERGTGLGLIICKEFVEKNGGKIWAQSEEGVGTTFKISLSLSAN